MGNLSVYIMLLFSITLGLYLTGADSPFMGMVQALGVEQSGQSAQAKSGVDIFFDLILNIFTNGKALAALGVGTGGAFVAGRVIGGGNSLVMYVVPILVIQAIMNLLVFPTKALFSQSMPFVIGAVIFSILNILLLLAIVEFMRGGSV